MRLSRTLLFKKEDLENLKNWRPISLLNVDYKLIAKVISQRLRVVMPSLIHPDQSCAVPGRSSEDNATLLRDISDYVQSNNLKCAFIAIDQEKAFDYVDWGFMHKVLARMNFGPIIRGIIKYLYTRVQSAILSNGTLSEFFDVHRGVRQGCPLSPLLFVLVSECFGQLVRSCKEIQGITLPGGRESKISQYADDNTCFVTNDYGLLKVLDVFEQYGRASGAKLNRTKSKGLWLGRWRQRSDSPGGLMWSNSTIKIVGFHFGDESAFAKTWEAGKAKFSKVLTEWKSRFLTLRGKCTVINSLAAACVWHLVRIYPPTREILNVLRKAMWKFIWSNKPELVGREICVSDLTSGGLKAVDIETRSKCLLIPRVFKFLEKGAAPWKDLMRYYIGRSIGVNENSKPNCDTPSEFYGIVLRVLRELQVDVATSKSSSFFYAMAITNIVIPVRPACQIKWDTNFRGLIWKDIWKRVHSGLEDPVLRDFYWRTVHLVLNVNTVLNKRNSRISATCSRCNNRWESLAHALIHCPFVEELWHFVLRICNRIDQSITVFSERTLLLGETGSRINSDLTRYLISVAKFAAWKERNSYQFNCDQKISCLSYFKYYVSNRLKMEFFDLNKDMFRATWCVNEVLGKVVGQKLVRLL